MTRTIECQEIKLTEDLLAEAGTVLLIYKDRLIEVIPPPQPAPPLQPVSSQPIAAPQAPGAPGRNLRLFPEDEIVRAVAAVIRRGKRAYVRSVSDELGISTNNEHARDYVSREIARIAKRGRLVVANPADRLKQYALPPAPPPFPTPATLRNGHAIEAENRE